MDRALRGGARLVAVLCEGGVPPGLARQLAADLRGRFTGVHVPSPRLGPRGIAAWTLDRLHALSERPGGAAVAEPCEALLALAHGRAAEGGAVVVCLDAHEPLPPETAAWLADALVGAGSGLRLIALGPETPAFRAACRGLEERPAWIRVPAAARVATPPWERPRRAPRRRRGRVLEVLLAAAGLAALLLVMPRLGLIEPLDIVPTEWGVPELDDPESAGPAPEPEPEPEPVASPPPVAAGPPADAPASELAPAASPPRAPTPSPAPEPSPGARATGAARTPAATPPPRRAAPPDIVRVAPPEPGALVVNAIPPARIAVDGVDVGVTPIVRLPVSRGPHRVVATFADGRRVARDVEVGDEEVYLVFP